MTVVVPPPPPRGDAPRPPADFDTECYPNYWVLKFRPRGGPVYTFRLFEGQRFSRADVGRIDLLFGAYCAISFNGLGYDRWMIACARAGYTPAELKVVNDRIIVEKIKPWELGLPEWEPEDHVDVMEVAPGSGSLKLYGARLHLKRLRELPYSPDTRLTYEQTVEVDTYCENDLDLLQGVHEHLAPQLKQRERLSKRYGIDLRSKSDAQLSETVLKKRSEDKLGRRLFKQTVDPFLAFNYRVPSFIAYTSPQLQRALEVVRGAVFRLSEKLALVEPPELSDLTIALGHSVYRMGIGGLHSSEKKSIHRSDEQFVLRDNDVASYYPTLILNSGEFPPALGETFRVEYQGILDERLAAKSTQKKFEKAKQTSLPEYEDAKVDNEGGKIMVNGTFGKTNSPYSILFAPTMFIQTTITGQLAILMLIEWHELYGIQVVSANTDGFVVKCPRDLIPVSEALITEWQRRTGLEMETVEYKALYSRDVNSYVAVKPDGSTKRKGEYASTRNKNGQPDLQTKKNPDVEICSDAVADYLANGTPVEYTIAACRDITKFITMQVVAGGGVKLWGEGPRKDARVRDMIPLLEACGWVKRGRKWVKPYTAEQINRVGGGTGAPVPGYEPEYDARSAYETCFAPQRPEPLGKVVRWYYSTKAPGPIVYASNGNTVSLSYGAKPCMDLPELFPDDIDHAWYIAKAKSLLADIGLSSP